jgi:rhodanese-related sulfurtransferase
VDELGVLLSDDDPPIVLDVRSRSSYEHDKARIAGDVRVFPDQVIEWAEGESRDKLVVAYCT